MNFDPKFLKKVSRNIFEIIGVFDQVRGGEHEYGQKTGTESSFRHHFGKKNPENLGFSMSNISVAMWRVRSIFRALV